MVESFITVPHANLIWLDANFTPKGARLKTTKPSLKIQDFQ